MIAPRGDAGDRSCGRGTSAHSEFVYAVADENERVAEIEVEELAIGAHPVGREPRVQLGFDRPSMCDDPDGTHAVRDEDASRPVDLLHAFFNRPLGVADLE